MEKLKKNYIPRMAKQEPENMSKNIDESKMERIVFFEAG